MNIPNPTPKQWKIIAAVVLVVGGFIMQHTGGNWLHSVWFKWVVPSLEGNGPEDVIAIAVFSAFLPKIRKWMTAEVHQHLTAVHQKVTAIHEAVTNAPPTDPPVSAEVHSAGQTTTLPSPASPKQSPAASSSPSAP